MSYQLYSPECKEDAEEIKQAEEAADKLINDFIEGKKKWGNKFMRVGAYDTESQNAITLKLLNKLGVRIEGE